MRYVFAFEKWNMSVCAMNVLLYVANSKVSKW